MRNFLLYHLKEIQCSDWGRGCLWISHVPYSHKSLEPFLFLFLFLNNGQKCFFAFLFIEQIWFHNLVNNIVICLTIEMKPMKEQKTLQHFAMPFYVLFIYGTMGIFHLFGIHLCIVVIFLICFYISVLNVLCIYISYFCLSFHLFGVSV